MATGLIIMSIRAGNAEAQFGQVCVYLMCEMSQQGVTQELGNVLMLACVLIHCL